MKVHLKRDLFLGGSRYRQRADGTELPDHITGEDGVVRQVVLPVGKKGKIFDPEKYITLPEGTEEYVPGGLNRHQRRDRRLIGDQGKTQPMALSELPKHQQAAEAAGGRIEAGTVAKAIITAPPGSKPQGFEDMEDVDVLANRPLGEKPQPTTPAPTLPQPAVSSARLKSEFANEDVVDAAKDEGESGAPPAKTGTPAKEDAERVKPTTTKK